MTAGDLSSIAGTRLIRESTPELARILHVNSGNLYGGVEAILATLARLKDLCPAMQSHFALCQEGRLSQELREAGAGVHILGGVRMSRPWTVRSARRRLQETLRHKRFQMVICHMPWSLAVFGGVVRAEGQRLGFWAHGFHQGRGWLELLAKATKPDIAIANSAFTETGLANLFPDVPHQVVYAPSPLMAPAKREQWRSSVREREGIPQDHTVILQVSRLESWKGHILHLEALSKIQASPKWTCWIVGGPQKPEEEKYLEELRQTAGRLGIGGRVKFLGQRSDVPQLLAAADIFCQPNQGPEPFGMVFIEALSAGCPVVATGIGGALEIVDESCGMLIQAGNAGALAESLGRLIERPELRARLGAMGPARARQLCDPERQMKKLMDLSLTAAESARAL